MGRLARPTAMLRLALAVYWRASPARVLIKAGLTVLGGLVPVAAAWAMKSVVDALAGGAGVLTWPLLALGLLGLLTAAFGPLDRYLDRELERRIALASDRALFTAVAGLEGIDLLERPEFHDRLRMAVQGGETGPRQVAAAVLAGGQSLILAAGFIGTLAQVSPLAAALVGLGAGPSILAQLRLGRRRVAVTASTTPRLRRRMFFITLLTDPRAAKEIRLFDIGGYLLDRLLGEVSQAQRQERRLDRGALAVEVALATMTALIAVAATVALVLRIRQGLGTVGDLAVLTVALSTVQAAVAGTASQLGALRQTSLMLEHFQYIRSLDGAGSGGATVAPVTAHGGTIEFHDVWFRYDDNADWVIRGLHLTIHAGQTVALVGPNGAGKSTVVKLLCRLYRPSRGRITWDGRDIAEIPVHELRNRLAAIFQDFMTYELTVAENIAVGDLTALAEPDRIARAAHWAGIGDTVERLPDGYDTLLSRSFEADAGPRRGGGAGTWLSGGQWQRLAIARVALRPRAELVILDEPSSGLDPEAEYEIHQRLRALRGGRTTLVISHRLNTVRDADHLLYLDGGAVTEHGDHATLLAADGAYARMFRLQQQGYLAEPDDLPAPTTLRGAPR